MQAYKPGSVTFARGQKPFVIYLALPSQAGSIDLPTPGSRRIGIGRAALGPEPI